MVVITVCYAVGACFAFSVEVFGRGWSARDNRGDENEPTEKRKQDSSHLRTLSRGVLEWKNTRYLVYNAQHYGLFTLPLQSIDQGTSRGSHRRARRASRLSGEPTRSDPLARETRSGGGGVFR